MGDRTNDADGQSAFIKRVREELEDKGRILEIAVYQKLRKNGWNAEVSVPYWEPPSRVLSDSQQEKGKSTDSDPYSATILDQLRNPRNKTLREYDVLARKYSSLGSRGWWSVLEVNLVIECKRRSDESWVFVREPKLRPYELIKSFETLNLLSGSELDILEVSEDSVLDYRGVYSDLKDTSHHDFQHLSHVSHIGYSIFGGFKDNNVRIACEQAASAADYQFAANAASTFLRSRFAGFKMRSTWRMYPVVLTDAPIIEAVPTGDDVKLAQIPWITFLHRRPQRSYLIDIVSWDSFSEYVKVIDSEMNRFNEAASKLDEVASRVKLERVNWMNALVVDWSEHYSD